MTEPRVTEDQLHTEVANYLAWCLPDNVVWHHSPNEGKRGPKARSKLFRHGTVAGWPDIELVYRGRAVFVELKTTKGRVAPVQRVVHRNLTLAGAPVIVCRSVAEVDEFLRGVIQIPLRHILTSASLIPHRGR